MQCPKCNAPELHERSEAKPRAVAFLVFGLVLVGAGGAMHLFGVKIWPWWLYGMGGFVGSQAAMKWLDSTIRFCSKCNYTMSVWPWTKEQGGRRKDEELRGKGKGEREKSQPPTGPLTAATASSLTPPPLVAVKQRFAGETIERALYRFEDQCSEENVDGVTVQEHAKTNDCILVRYEVSWKHSVFDEQGYDSYVSWALLAPADPAAGDPPDARFRVASATAEHHNL